MPYCCVQVEESMLVQFEHMTIHSAGEEESTGRDLFYLRSTQTTFLSWGLALALVDDSHVDRAAKWCTAQHEPGIQLSFSVPISPLMFVFTSPPCPPCSV